MSKRTKGNRSKAGTSNVLDLVLYTAHKTLSDRDGRCAGIKFNKLVFSIYSKFSRAENPKFHFRLPYRWYLYGAVLDSAELGGVVTFDHPEDELKSNVHYQAPRPKMRNFEEIRSEVEQHCIEFSNRYVEDLHYQEMLREHYSNAPLPFQRSYLEWSFHISDMYHGSQEISAPILLKALSGMGKTYPNDLEPRLTPSFNRVYLCVEGILKDAKSLTFNEIGIILNLTCDFWTVFCLFLSQNYNKNISAGRLEAYHKKAEQELVAYKRRLSAALATTYLENIDTGEGYRELDRESLRELSAILELRYLRTLGD